MSLLWLEYESEFEHLVEASYARESRAKAEYFNSLSERARKIIYRDTRYNIDYLYTAYVLDDKKIMNTYACLLYTSRPFRWYSGRNFRQGHCLNLPDTW